MGYPRKSQTVTATPAKPGELSILLEIIAWMSGTIGFQTIVLVGAVVALARLSH